VSRNVIRIDIPQKAKPVDTGVMLPYPSQAPSAKATGPGNQIVETTKKSVEPGNYRETIEVTKGLSTGAQAAASTPKSANILSATFNVFNATTNVPFVGVVANFKNPPPAPGVAAIAPISGNYAYFIDWGDNSGTDTSPTGFSQRDADSLDIIGSHI